MSNNVVNVNIICPDLHRGNRVEICEICECHFAIIESNFPIPCILYYKSYMITEYPYIEMCIKIKCDIVACAKESIKH